MLIEKKGEKYSLAFILLIILILSGIIVGIYEKYAQKPDYYSDTQFIMDTVISIKVYGSKDQARKVLGQAFQEIERIQKKFDRYAPDSEVALVNASAGKSPVKVSQEVMSLTKKTIALSKKSGGVFDLTIGPLVDLWGVGKKGDFVPSDAEIAECLPLVGDDKLIINEEESTLFLPTAGMSLDFGGVVKGYAVDRAIEILRANGIESALVNAGGTVRVVGKRDDGEEWLVGVQDPRNSEEIAAKIAMQGWDTLETSGDYQRSFEKDGIIYSHIVDGRNGKQPRKLASVTIANNDATLGDILSTSFFIIGAEESLRLLPDFKGVEAVFIKTDGKIIYSDGIKNKNFH